MQPSVLPVPCDANQVGWQAQFLTAEKITLTEGAQAAALLMSPDDSGCAVWMPLADLLAILDARYAPKGP